MTEPVPVTSICALVLLSSVSDSGVPNSLTLPDTVTAWPRARSAPFLSRPLKLLTKTKMPSEAPGVESTAPPLPAVWM